MAYENVELYFDLTWTAAAFPIELLINDEFRSLSHCLEKNYKVAHFNSFNYILYQN